MNDDRRRIITPGMTGGIVKPPAEQILDMQMQLQLAQQALTQQAMEITRLRSELQEMRAHLVACVVSGGDALEVPETVIDDVNANLITINYRWDETRRVLVWSVISRDPKPPLQEVEPGVPIETAH